MSAPSRHRANFVGGRWVSSGGSSTIDVIDPSTEDAIASVAEGVPSDVDDAVTAATAAFADWSATTPRERAALLRQIGSALVERSGALARLISREVGSPLAFSASTQVGLPIDVIHGVADEVDEFAWETRIDAALIVREPVGVVGAITPWNYPLHQMVAKIAAALGAGCTVVAKPSEVAPLSAFVLAEIFEEVELPPGVCNFVSGLGPVVGEAIAAHPGIDAVSLTGSPGAGRRVMELAAPTAKKVTLELGGKSANVILDDVDIEAIVPGCVTQCFRNAGQNCSALSRLVVPRPWLARVEEIAAAMGGSFVVGDPFNPTTEMGPLASAGQRARVLGHIGTGIDEGARLLCGGLEQPAGCDRGYFVRPTVFSAVDPGMHIAQEEIFGPVLCIMPYDDEAQAVAIANDTRYGLAGSVWSADDERAVRVARKMRTGRVVVNGGAFNARAPFGGYKQSGVGRELGRFGLEEFLEVKTLQC